MLRIFIPLVFLTNLYSIVPPKNGNFTREVLEKLNNQEIGQDYGNPGWVKKLSKQNDSELRNIQLQFSLPVLLGKYSDASNTYFDETDYQQLLFGNNPTGSMKEYFEEISYGNFDIDGQVSGWDQSSFTKSQAVDNTRQYVAEVASLSDSDFDYGQFDNDGPDNIPNSGDDDGYVDGIAVVYPGCLDGSNNIWAHQSSLGSYQYVTNDLTPNGNNIIIDTYMVCPELPGSQNCITSEICPMGIFAHEFGHVLGLPDLYDRDDSNGGSEGLGEWCLMASGSWLGWYGDTPSHMSSWCKIQLGWMSPTIISTLQNEVMIPQLATSSTAIKIWEDDYRLNRYFLIENRQNYGFDYYINGSGLLIYHVNENRIAGFNSFGPVNDDENDKMIDLESADGLTHLDDEINRGDAGDPFPGSTNNILFSDNTIPSSITNDGLVTGISIAEISLSDSIMYANITPKSSSGYALFYDEYGISNTALTIGTDEQWSGVHFTSNVPGFVTEIDFGLVWEVYWNTDQLNWEVNIYDSFDGTSPGTLYQTISGNSFVGGWHTVGIDSMEIGEGQDFFIAVKFNNNGYVYAFDNLGPFSERSYLSSNGVTFDDQLSLYGDANIRAKISTDQYVSTNNKSFIPKDIQLNPNYPNPFNPQTTLSFTLHQIGKVSLDVYDINGKHIESLIKDVNYYSGNHNVSWDASNKSSGVYLISLVVDTEIRNQKIMLIK